MAALSIGLASVSAPKAALANPVATAPAQGYDLVAADGGVFGFRSPYYGSTGGQRLTEPIVGMATTADGGGYWLVAADGGVFSFGNARFHGSTGGVRLTRPIVGMALDPATGGYWLVASDGGIFAFDAPYYGSTGGLALTKPIVGMAATPDGRGYWLVASDGGIFTFGDARFHGSTGAVALARPIVGMAVDPATWGYWLAASDGGIFAFGAPFYGSSGGRGLTRPIVAMTATPLGSGYWLAASDGGVFAFGDARYLGSTGGVALTQPIVGMAGPGALGPCPGLQVPAEPYSPGCVDFEGNNGGSSAAGVTRDTITLAYRLSSSPTYGQVLAQLAGAQSQDSNAATEQTIQTLVSYFDAHYQFYGRKLRVVFYAGQGSPANEIEGQGAPQAAADASTVAARIHAFADISAQSALYAEDLAAHHVMTFGDLDLPLSWHQQHAPFAWSAATDGTWLAGATADYAVQKLCGGSAGLAGGSLQGQPRKFVVVTPQNEPYGEVGTDLQGVMANAGCQASLVRYRLDLGTESQQAANLVSELKGNTDTTVICACDPIFPVYLSGQGFSQSYFPEFVEVGIGGMDRDFVGRLYNQTFMAHAFGLTSSGPTTSPSRTAGYRAFKSVDPRGTSAFFVDDIYRQLEQVAIGVEMAGPNLTPQTFQKGMFRYPARRGPDGLWTFSIDQFTSPNDTREVCWSAAATSPFDGRPGAYVGTSPARWPLFGIPKGPPGCPS